MPGTAARSLVDDPSSLQAPAQLRRREHDARLMSDPSRQLGGGPGPGLFAQLGADRFLHGRGKRRLLVRMGRIGERRGPCSRQPGR
jgi:hypothetical protein